MEKEKLSEKSAGKYVSKALVFIGYPENIRVITKFRDDGCIFFEAIYQVFYRGKMVDIIMPLSTHNYYDMLKYGLELSGKKIIYINHRVKDEKISYTIGYSLLNCDRSLKKGLL